MVPRPIPSPECRHAPTLLVVLLVRPTPKMQPRTVRRTRTSAFAAAVGAPVKTGAIHATDVVVAEVLPPCRRSRGPFVPDAPSSDAMAIIPVAGDVQGAPAPSTVDPAKESPRLNPLVGATRGSGLTTEITTKGTVMVPGAAGRTRPTSAATCTETGRCATNVAQTQVRLGLARTSRRQRSSRPISPTPHSGAT